MNFDLYIREFPEAFSSEVCDRIISKFEDDPRKHPGRTAGGVQSIKTSIDLGISSGEDDWKDIDTDIFNTISPIIQEYLKDLSDVLKIDFRITDTGYQIQKSPKGEGSYGPHFDGFTPDSSNRLLSVIVYLNNVDEGGETSFPDLDINVIPVKGKILIFPAQFPMLHEGKIPISGDKYIISTFVVTSEF
jgi:hypothetical protein